MIDRSVLKLSESAPNGPVFARDCRQVKAEVIRYVGPIKKSLISNTVPFPSEIGSPVGTA